MPRRVDDYRGLTQLSRLRLLRALQAQPGLTLSELADITKLHPNTAREHLHVLKDEGLVVEATLHRGGRGRPPVVYSPVTQAVESEPAQRRLQRAQEHGDLLRRVAPELDHTAELGEAGVHQLDALYEHLDDAGLEPDIHPETLTVDLVPCPYHTAVAEDRALVCAVHAQLIQDVLSQVPGPVEFSEMHPFTTPHSCSLVLRARGDAARADGTAEASAI